MRIRYIMLALVLLSQAAFSAEFRTYDIEYDAGTQTIRIDASLYIENVTAGLDFTVFAHPRDLKITSSVPMEYRLDPDGRKILIDFIEPTIGTVDIAIEFKADLTESLDTRELFSMAFEAPLDISDFSLSLILPETSQVYYQDGQALVSPRADVETDGKRIILVWNAALDQSESFIAIASYTKPQKEVSLTPIVLIAAAVLVAALLFMWNYLKQKSHKPIVSSMSEDERELFSIIKSHKGVTQEELREKTGYSKSKISKLIRNLEKMDVVRKIPYKKTNRLEAKL